MNDVAISCYDDYRQSTSQPNLVGLIVVVVEHIC